MFEQGPVLADAALRLKRTILDKLTLCLGSTSETRRSDRGKAIRIDMLRTSPDRQP